MSQIIINGQPLYQVDLPEMTLAEWLALPVAERPKEWIRTDAEYTDIPAENVSYGDGSVKDALDDLGDVVLLGQVNTAGSAQTVSFSTGTLADYRFVTLVVNTSQGTTCANTIPAALFSAIRNFNIYFQNASGEGKLIGSANYVSDSSVSLLGSSITYTFANIQFYGVK